MKFLRQLKCMAEQLIYLKILQIQQAISQKVTTAMRNSVKGRIWTRTISLNTAQGIYIDKQ